MPRRSESRLALTWAAFAIPALGAIVGLVGYALIVAPGDSDAILSGGVSRRLDGSIGLLAMAIGSSLFAIATWWTRALSRHASGLLAIGAALVILALFGASGALPPPIAIVPIVAAVVVFPRRLGGDARQRPARDQLRPPLPSKEGPVKRLVGWAVVRASSWSSLPLPRSRATPA